MPHLNHLYSKLAFVTLLLKVCDNVLLILDISEFLESALHFCSHSDKALIIHNSE